MPTNCLSVLYKHIIQVENKNVGLKVGGTNIPLPPNKKSGGARAPPPPPPRFLRQCKITHTHTQFNVSTGTYHLLTTLDRQPQEFRCMYEVIKYNHNNCKPYNYITRKSRWHFTSCRNFTGTTDNR